MKRRSGTSLIEMVAVIAIAAFVVGSLILGYNQQVASGTYSRDFLIAIGIGHLTMEKANATPFSDLLDGTLNWSFANLPEGTSFQGFQVQRTISTKSSTWMQDNRIQGGGYFIILKQIELQVASGGKDLVKLVSYRVSRTRFGNGGV